MWGVWHSRNPHWEDTALPMSLWNRGEGQLSNPSVASQNCRHICVPKRRKAGALPDASAPSDVPENAKRHAHALQSANMRYEAVPFAKDSGEWLLNWQEKKLAKGVDSPDVRLYN